jgi:hypothetical protein
MPHARQNPALAFATEVKPRRPMVLHAPGVWESIGFAQENRVGAGINKGHVQK